MKTEEMARIIADSIDPSEEGAAEKAKEMAEMMVWADSQGGGGASSPVGVPTGVPRKKGEGIPNRLIPTKPAAE